MTIISTQRKVILFLMIGLFLIHCIDSI
jgi:hypothetical protein